MGRAAAKQAKFNTKSDRKLDRKLHRNFKYFYRFWGSSLDTFGNILASKSRSKFYHNFGMLFCRIPRLQGDCEGTSAPLRRRSRRRGFLQAAPLFAREGIIITPRIAGPRVPSIRASQSIANEISHAVGQRAGELIRIGPSYFWAELNNASHSTSTKSTRKAINFMATPENPAKTCGIRLHIFHYFLMKETKRP